VSRALVTRFAAGKINVAALGNQVPQLHVHVIARHAEDPAWPSPVWGVGTPQRYPVQERDATCALLRTELDAE
jgi:diadenosine tetraphosphate (Ap4A) HIT family hydrolase